MGNSEILISNTTSGSDESSRNTPLETEKGLGIERSSWNVVSPPPQTLERSVVVRVGPVVVGPNTRTRSKQLISELMKATVGVSQVIVGVRTPNAVIDNSQKNGVFVGDLSGERIVLGLTRGQSGVTFLLTSVKVEVLFEQRDMEH